MFNKPSGSAVSGGNAAVASGSFEPSQEAVNGAGQAVPVDQKPVAYASPIPAGSKTHIEDAVDGLALTAGFAEMTNGAPRIAAAQAREIPALFRAASVAREQCERETHLLTEISIATRKYLGARVDRTKATGRKAAALMCGLAAGEVMLNASAAIAVGDPTWVAITTFGGIGLAALAVGWLCGSLIRDHHDRAEAGEAPPEAKQMGLGHLFDGPGTSRAEMPAVIGLLVAFGLAMAVLVYVLRASAGLPPAFAVASFFVGIAAAFPAYMVRNRAADLLKANHEQRAKLKAEARGEAQVQDRHTGLQSVTEGLRLEVKNRVLAARIGTGARARMELAVKNAHMLGQYQDAKSLPFGNLAPISLSADTAELAAESDLVMRTDFAETNNASRLEVSEAGQAANTESEPSKHPHGIDMSASWRAEPPAPVASNGSHIASA